MSRFSWKKQIWKKRVNLVVQMQAIFKVRSQAKLQSPRHAQLMEKYDGGSPKLANVIDVRRPKHRVLRRWQLRCDPAHCNASICVSSTRDSKAVIYCYKRQSCPRRKDRNPRPHHQWAIKKQEWNDHSRQSRPMSETLFNNLPGKGPRALLPPHHPQLYT